MKRGALDAEVIMFINDLRERCGSGRSGSSCHVIGIIDEIHKKVGKGFTGKSVKRSLRSGSAQKCRIACGLRLGPNWPYELYGNIEGARLAGDQTSGEGGSQIASSCRKRRG